MPKPLPKKDPKLINKTPITTTKRVGGPKKQARTAKRRMERAQRLPVLADMQAKGYTRKQMVEATGVSEAQIFTDIKAILEELALRSTESIRKFRSEQANIRMAMIKAHIMIALDPNDERCNASAAIVDKNQTALAKLYGLDAPTVHQHLIDTADTAQVAEKVGVVIEVAGDNSIDWEAAREMAENARNTIDHDAKMEFTGESDAEIIDIEPELGDNG